MMNPLHGRTQGIRMHLGVPDPFMEGLLGLDIAKQDACPFKIAISGASSCALQHAGMCTFKITWGSGTCGFNLSPPIKFNTGSVSSHHSGATLCMSSLQVRECFKPVTPKLSQLHLLETGHDRD